ncbi:3-hydroxyacyl-CoA dehydrogenase family protein [Cupriavidus necator]|uniref:3-hydroxyacyl-CoA dehydrogenase n=1 Tax=Cupriavidus pinatubonensis (strain JMP 134 / LMG 1197) TaxID=264198 RepID=Q46MP3_CUPPJ|nr:3-hydroxyacyl-CoA dehydrogenase family protein [Cupriavidus necator]
MSWPDSSRARVAVLGAGLMGHGIALAFMTSDFDVAIWDPVSQAREAVRERIAEHLELMGDPRGVDVRVCSTLQDCVRDCDIVVEAAPESVSTKRELIREIDLVNSECIIASNTSVLRITEIAEGSADPGRVVGTHWWNPPYLMPLVEVVRGELTREGVAKQVSQWLSKAGKTPVDVYRDVPGFVGNRMQFALVREAAHIVEQGICSAETVDLVARLTFGRRLAAVGPLRNADFIGLDLTCAILDYLSPSLADNKRAPALFREKLDAGKAGAKAGGGVFQWADGERAAAEQHLLNHLMTMHQNGT